MVPDLTQLPLEFIDGAIDVLRIISLEETLPSTVRLCLGILEIRSQPRNYIALPWSPLCVDQKLGFPIQPLDSETIRKEGYTQVLSMVSQSLASIESHPPTLWQGITDSQLKGCPAQGMSSISLVFAFPLLTVFRILQTDEGHPISEYR